MASREVKDKYPPYRTVLSTWLINNECTEPFTDVDGDIDDQQCKVPGKPVVIYPRSVVKSMGDQEVLGFYGQNFTLTHGIGSVYSNKPFIRILLNHETQTLFISFRPLNIANIQTILGYTGVAYWWWGARSYVNKLTDGQPTRDKIIAVMSNFVDRRLKMIGETGIGVKQGDYNLLHMYYKLCNYENGTSTIVKQGVPYAIANIINGYVQVRAVKQVIFSGFSLGGGQSTVCSVLTSMLMDGQHPPFILLSCCGEPAGNSKMVQYIENKFIGSINTVVEEDIVSREVGELRNFGPTMLVKFSDGGMANFLNMRWSKLPLSASDKDAEIKKYFLNKPSSFKRYHLAAEDIVPLILWQKINTTFPARTYVNDIEVSSDKKLLCKWYDDISYAKKFGICDRALCVYDVDEKGMGSCVFTNNMTKIGPTDLQPGAIEKHPDFGNIVAIERKIKGAGPQGAYERIRSYFGSHYDTLIKAEAAYISVMNDLDIKTLIMRNIIKSLRKGKEYYYLGSFLLVDNDKIDRARRQDPDVYSVHEMAEMLRSVNTQVKGTYLFICGGSFLPDNDSAHHLAFAWSPLDRKMTMFNPGTSCWAPKLTQLVVTAVKKGIPNVRMTTDQYVAVGQGSYGEANILTVIGNLIPWKREYGPQDYTRRGVIRDYLWTMDVFCQTWTVFWLCNFISGCTISSGKWPVDALSLDICIRRFVLWILKQFSVVATYSNEQFWRDSDRRTTVFDELLEGYKRISPAITVPSVGECCFNYNLKVMKRK